MRRSFLLVMLLVAAAGCQTLPDIPDKRIEGGGVTAGYRFGTLSRPPGNTDGTLVLLAFSGGGARAAALAYGVLEVLHDTEIGVRGRRRSLLAEVDVISGTSGGSFTAAFYGLYREAMFRRGADGKRLFERRYLKRPATRELLSRGVRSLLRINTLAVNRSDVAAEYYGETIFGRRTYAHLRRAGRPFIAINAHDTTKLSRFVFHQDQFDLICGDLSDYPVARAVTASSAVHGVFAPIKLRNFSPGRAGCPAEPAWVAAAMAGVPAARSVIETPRDRRRLARIARWYRNGEAYGRPPVKDARYYVHLADGGVMDNIALWPILRALGSPVSAWGIQELLRRGRVRRVLLIVVNAMPFTDSGADRNQAGPNLANMLLSAVDSAINTSSQAAIRSAEVLFEDLRRRYPRVGFHGPVVVEFAAIRDAARRRCFDATATALDLPPAQVDALRALAAGQLEANPRYRAFLRTVAGRRTGAEATGRAQTYCPPGPGRQAAR